MEEQTFELSLKLSLPGKTLKKLKSYAMLSGISVSDLEAKLVAQVEPQLAGHFDQVLTDSIMEMLGELDGVKLTMERPVTEQDQDVDGHQLSGDDDDGDNKSLEEQVAPTSSPIQLATQAADDLRFDIKVPDAGDDAELFVDNAMGTEQVKQVASGGGAYGSLSPMTKTSKSFDSRRPRVSISEHTGDED